MQITLESLALAIVLMIAIESLLPSISPRSWQQLLSRLAEVPPARVQRIGLVFLFASLATLLLLT